MRTLSEIEYYNEAYPALRQIFKNEDPYDKPFAVGIESKLILHEYWYSMESLLLEVIVDSALHQGDTGFYVSILDRPKAEEQKQPYHWYIPFRNITSYNSLVGPLQNVVYSPNGIWAIMGSDEHFGLLGATNNFVNMLRKQMPTIDNEVNGFLEEWVYNKKQYNSNLSWMRQLLSNVYNEKIAEDLLQKYKLIYRPER